MFLGLVLRMDGLRAGGGGGGAIRGWLLDCSSVKELRDGLACSVEKLKGDTSGSDTDGLVGDAMEGPKWDDWRWATPGRRGGGGAGACLFTRLSGLECCESTDDRGWASSSKPAGANVLWLVLTVLLSDFAWPRRGGGAGVDFLAAEVPTDVDGAGGTGAPSLSGTLPAASRANMSSASSSVP